MGRNGVILAVLIALLGVGARFSGQVSGQSKQQSTAAQKTTPPSDAVPDEGPCAAIRGFLDPEARAARANDPSPCIPATARIGFLIATVPDPVNTRLALVFDRTIESLQSAMQDSGYSYVGNYLPWRETEPDKNESDRQARLARESLPGVLLFREADPPEPNRADDCAALYSQHLGVLLVAETPTGGVNRKEFANAMALVRQARQGRAGAASCKVPVLGPNFSGSMSSLYEALQTQQNTGAFRVITGTATSQYKWRWMRSKNVDFRSVVHDDSTAARMLILHLRKEWNKTGPIAVVSEDETSYGADLSRSGVPKTQAPPAPDKENVPGTDELVLNIRFPRQVSRLRNAYSDNPALVAESKSKSDLPQQNLRLDLRGSTTDQDSVPNFSKGQTPVSQDAVLTAIATALRRERIRFAIVGATDPLDTIFIVRALRTLCPDVRLVVLSAELLFVTAAAETPLDGVLAVTTYPLFLRNQHWTHYQLNGGQPRRLQFPSSLSQGTYNAARALLLQELGRVGARHEDELLEYFAPSVNETEAETSERPPLWITALSRGGFWPISLSALPNDAVSEPIMQAWPHRGVHRNPGPGADTGLFRPDRLPRIYVLSFLVFSALCATAAIAVLGAHIFKPWKNSSKSAIFSAQADESEPLGRAAYLLISLLALLATYLLFAAPLWRLRPQPPIGRSFTLCLYGSLLPLALLAGSILSILGSVFPLSSTVLLKKNLTSFRRSPHTILGLVATALFTWVCWAVLTIVTEEDSFHRGFFFAYRSVDLGSGLSPIAPFLILGCAICVWAWTHNRRLLTEYERRPALPDIGDPSVIRLARELDISIRRPFLDLLFRVFLAGAIIFGTFAFLSGYTQSLETIDYDRGYLALLGLVVFLTFLTLFRFMRSWSALRKLLEQLERHPVRHAFTLMTPEPAWSPILLRGMLKRTYGLETRARDIAMKIATLEGTIHQSGDVSDLELKVKEMFDVVGKNRRLPPEKRQAIGALLQKLQAKAVAYLQSGPWTAGYSEALAAGGKGEPLELLANEFAALPFRMYIRYALLQLRNLLTFVGVAFVLTLVSINSYPFQSHHIMGWVMSAVFVMIGVIVAWVFVQMDRDALLSRLTNTPAGKVDKTGLVLRLATIGLVPTLTVLSTQFPSVSRFLFSWLQPTLEALR